MAVAGISAYLSLRKRRGNLLRLLGERGKKLLLGFIFGMIIVAIPSNFVIQVNFLCYFIFKFHKGLNEIISSGVEQIQEYGAC
jgi:hypothetical protein